MKGQVQQNIQAYMNARNPNRHYTYYDLYIIKRAITAENINRKEVGIVIDGKTSNGRLQIAERTATIANGLVGNRNYCADDIRLYKRCFYDEYEARTGKCRWGFPEMRSRYGYDPVTGYEMAE